MWRKLLVRAPCSGGSGDYVGLCPRAPSFIFCITSSCSSSSGLAHLASALLYHDSTEWCLSLYIVGAFSCLHAGLPLVATWP